MSDSIVKSSKRLWGLGGTTATKKCEPDLRGGRSPSSPKPDQALEGGQLNSTDSSRGYHVARGKTDGRIGCKNSVDLVD